MDKKILRDISYGMYIVSAQSDKKVGCVINTLTQITSENPIITISLNKENYTNEIIKKTNKFSVSILSEQTNPSVISTFGFQTSKDKDKFENINYKEIDNIPIINENICGYIICEVIDIVDAETHNIFIARIIDASKINNLKPMTYTYYHEVIKGKAPKKAPTYIEEEITSKQAWVCDICGYIYEGDLPEDFICPICGATREVFRKK